jgi:O-antigen/teichoic acid export membrane protein
LIGKTQIHGPLLARNTVLNLIGSIVPAGIALLVTPYVIHGLGVERFGILSLAWAILWYSSYFDLGLNRATTKFSSEVVSKGEPGKIAAILWTSLGIQTLLGFLAAGVVVAVTPLLVDRILHIPPSLARETEFTFVGIAATIPFFLASGILSALLGGVHRFDLVNAVKIPANSTMFLFPALGVYLGYRLPGIIVLLLLSRALMALALLLTCVKIFPGLMSGRKRDESITRPLLKFGGWVMVCNVLIPVLVYVDRFVIGALISIAAVTYYSVPYEVVSRLQIVPGSIGTTLFPALIFLSVEGRERLKRLYMRSLKTVMLLIVPAAVLLVIFARDGLRIWVGADFAAHSASTLQVLSAGLVLNGLSQMPANLLDAVGRPDLRAKVFLVYLIPYLAALWFCTKHFGILGAAIAWTLRGAVELILFVLATSRLLGLPVLALAENGMLRAIATCGGLAACLLFVSSAMSGGFLIHGLADFTGVVAFAAVTWRFVLDGTDRQSLLSVIGGQR